MTRRREFSDRIKNQAAERADGKCEKCTARLYAGKTHYDHVIPDALGGEPVLSNCEVLCIACHSIKSSKQDVPAIAKMKRIKAKHNGIRKSGGRPMAGTKASGWKQTIGGRWERRT